jgi:hypothetical protein
MSWTTGARAFAAACMFVCINSHAQTSAPLVNTVHTVAAATQAVPVEETFNITTAGTYQVTLTDLGAQISTSATLTSGTLAITTGSTVVGTPLVTTSGSTSWSTTFSATPGTYMIHVVGTTSPVPGSGSTVPGPATIGMQVTNTANNSQVASFSDTLALPANGTPSNVGTLGDSFTVSTAGNYLVTLTDMQLPTALTTLTLAITAQGSATLLTDPSFGTAPGTPTKTATVALQPGVTYQIFAGGLAGGVNAGLYGVNVSPAGGGTAVYTKTVPVGAVTAVGSPALTAAIYTLSFSDLAFPAALSQVAAAVTLNGQSVAQLNATGTSSAFSGTAVPYQVFALGLPVQGGQGSYTLSVQPANGTPVLNIARAVSDPTSGLFAYSFDTTASAGAYSLDLADFGYPASFTAIQAAAVQAGALLPATGSGGSTTTSLSGAGTLNITPVAGPVSLLVFAQPAPPASAGASTGGLFGIDLTESGAGAPAFQTSQGVGQLFSVQTATVSSGGSYQAVVADLGFPANFANLAVIVTRGTSKIGSIFGGGTLTFDATGGDYLINFVAQPSATAEAGTYSIVVGAAPPAATATLQVSPTSVSSGGTVTLTWTSANTSSCTASSSPSGAWSGSVASGGGTATSAALTATTTFTLTCVGDDGTSPSQTATVTVTPTTTSTHNGGGAIGFDVVTLLLGALGVRLLGLRVPVARDRLC